MRVITEGQKYPINPPGEGFCARISGASFDCLGFMSNISTTELNEFRDNDLRYGVYESPSTPFFLIQFQDSEFHFDISLNLPAEKKERQDDFLNNEGNIINLILCDYPAGIIQAIRLIGIRPNVMERIKARCRDQLSRSAEAIDRAISLTYHYISLEEMLLDADMYKVLLDL